MNVCFASTSYGQLRGEQLPDAQVFRGAPYAQPPMAELRWRPPQPALPWSGIRDALEFGAVAPQAMSVNALQKFRATMAEDCLYLNVWTPAADTRKRPVLVFIHGGGITSGFSSAPMLDGSVLAARGDVVVVTLNYRLGVLGSLYAPTVLGHDSVNLALQDQMAALQWLRNEAAAFGGDPGNITLIGQSSGAVCVACLLGSARAQGLFDRAILQSGGLERVIATTDSADIAHRFFSLLGANHASTLRQCALDQIMAAQATILGKMEFVPPRGEFHPTADGNVLPDHPLRSARDGRTHAVPVLLGTTAHEWRTFDAAFPDEYFSAALLQERASKLLGKAADAVLQIYQDEYGDINRSDNRRAIAAALVGDFHFTAPTTLFARHHAAAGNPVFHYVLEWLSPKPGVGACHNICLPLLFGTMAAAPTLTKDDTATRNMSRTMQDAWLAFARSDDPSTTALDMWPPYQPATRLSMVLNAEPHVVGNHRGHSLRCWEHVYPALC